METRHAPIALVTSSLPTLLRLEEPRIGRLFTPRMVANVSGTIESKVPWAADNDCFNGLDYDRWAHMLELISHPRLNSRRPGLLFVVVPDRVGDALETRRMFDEYAPEVIRRGHPAAYVLQDGETGATVPWADIEAVFIGGSTEYKVGPVARRLTAEAKDRGLWAHMGRVNTRGRYLYAAEIGCDSIDGSSFGRFPRLKVPALQGWMDEAEVAREAVA
jgi:hypothetical protein